jgi:prepilin-type N-terminal cleavage/methylation domain-containing protein
MTAARVGNHSPVRRTRLSDDDGFTLVELMVAMAVFSMLMAIVGAAMLSGFSGVRDIMARSDSQDKAQLAAQWLSRQLRYVALPEGEASAIVSATTSSLTFYTYSGSGGQHDLPYKVALSVTPTSGGKLNTIRAIVYTPLEAAGGGGWSWDPQVTGIPGVTHDFLSIPVANGVPLVVSVYMLNPTIDPAPTPSPAALTAVATPPPLPRNTGEIPGYVVVQVGDPTQPRSRVSQQVKLVNCDAANSC